jgi:hypothetical protein
MPGISSAPLPVCECLTIPSAACPQFGSDTLSLILLCHWLPSSVSQSVPSFPDSPDARRSELGGFGHTTRADVGTRELPPHPPVRLSYRVTLQPISMTCQAGSWGSTTLLCNHLPETLVKPLRWMSLLEPFPPLPRNARPECPWGITLPFLEH